jgi:hypothetical protein
VTVAREMTWEVTHAAGGYEVGHRFTVTHWHDLPEGVPVRAVVDPGETETPEQFRNRMRSIQVIKGGRTRPKEKIITRPTDPRDPKYVQGNTIDAGKRAKVVINEERDIILTTSDNRQDANIIGTPAIAGGAGGEEG